MADRLTQTEVDALVRYGAAAPPPPAPLALVRPWSFSRPARLPRERRLAFESALVEVARGWQMWLSSRLHVAVTVAADTVEPVPLSEWLESFDEPSYAFSFRLGGGATGSGVVDLGAPVAFALVDRLLGGPGDPHAPNRPLTELEQALLRAPIDRLLAEWRDAWGKRVALEPAITGYESSPGTIAITAPDAAVLVSHLSVRAPSFGGLVAIGVPVASIEPLAAAEPRPTAAPPRSPHGARTHQELGLQQARVTLAIRLPAVRLSTRSVLSLAPGQIIETGMPAEGTVELHVNGKACYIGSLGQRRRRLAVRVTQNVSASAPGEASRGFQGRVR